MKTYADTAGACGGNVPCFTTINAALDAVMVNGSVDVYAGTYTGDVALTSGVTLDLLGATTLTGGLSIASGTTFNSTSGNFSLTGDWTNNGTFNHNSGTVTFNGSGTQTLTGDTTFYNLTIGGSSILQTSSVVTVNGTTTHNAGSVTQETRSILADALFNFGLAGASVSFDNRGGLSSLQVNRTESPHPQENFAGGGANILNRYYTLTPNGNPTQADVCFGYSEAELGSLDESQLRLCRWTGSGWTCSTRGVSSNTTTNVVCADNIGEFSDWVIGQVGSTAVSLRAVTAQVRHNSILPYAFALGIAALVGAGWFVWRRRAWK